MFSGKLFDGEGLGLLGAFAGVCIVLGLEGCLGFRQQL
jgi:hypothetical protein